MAKTKKEIKTTNNLKVKLTTDELLDAGEKLAKTLDAIVEVEDEKKVTAKQYDARIKELEAQGTQLQGKVRNKWEWRNVDCVEVMDNKAVTVTTTRTDTGEVIETRKMTAGERQMKMWDE